MLLIATTDGVFRAPGPRFETAEHVLDCGHTERLCSTESGMVLAASRSGLYRTEDGGESWDRVDLPAEEAWTAATDSDWLYAGTYPAGIYRSDDGTTWAALEGFARYADRERWIAPHDPTSGRVMAIAVDPGDDDQLIVGIEVGGVHTSPDGGETWTHHAGLPDDVHHVLTPAPGEYLVSTGMLDTDHLYGEAGLHRTQDAGETWTRLDSGLDRAYFRESFVHGGVLYAAATRGPPPAWDEDGTDAALYESHDGGATFESVDYPGGPAAFVYTWAAVKDTVIAGTGPGAPGHLLVRTDDGWEQGGRLPAGVRSIVTA